MTMEMTTEMTPEMINEMTTDMTLEMIPELTSIQVEISDQDGCPLTDTKHYSQQHYNSSKHCGYGSLPFSGTIQ